MMIKFRSVNADQYRVIYDIAREGSFGMNDFIIVWLIGIVLMSVLAVVDLWWNRFSFEGYNLRNKLALVILPLFLRVGICANIGAYQIQSECLDARANGRHEIVEGIVTDLKRERKREEFKLGSVEFVHSKADGTKCGYKPDRGGRLREGVAVRLYRFEGQTLRIESAE